MFYAFSSILNKKIIKIAGYYFVNINFATNLSIYVLLQVFTSTYKRFNCMCMLKVHNYSTVRMQELSVPLL